MRSWLLERWRAAIAPLLKRRDRLLIDADFQRRSLHRLLTRPIARRRIRSLFDLCSGFVYSQVLLACTRLGLFARLAESPRSADDLADELAVPRASMGRLLIAAESLRLVEARGRGEYGLGPLGAALQGNPAVAMMIEHHSSFYADLEDPVALLRGESRPTRLSRFWAYSERRDPSSLDDAETGAYSELMAASQDLIADQVLTAYPVHGHQRLLDIGGGSGAFALAAMRRAPGLRAEVFDLPAVAERARARFEDAGFDRRATAHAGDVFVDRPPSGFDLVTLIRILHDHDDAEALAIVTAARRAVEPGGVVLVAEPMLQTRGSEPVAAAYFGFYLLSMGQGRPRSPSEISDLLHAAGFTGVAVHRTMAPLLVRVVTARAPGGHGFP